MTFNTVANPVRKNAGALTFQYSSLDSVCLAVIVALRVAEPVPDMPHVGEIVDGGDQGLPTIMGMIDRENPLDLGTLPGLQAERTSQTTTGSWSELSWPCLAFSRAKPNPVDYRRATPRVFKNTGLPRE